MDLFSIQDYFYGRDEELKIGTVAVNLECLVTHYIVTNMESRFPAMLVLWLGREFHRGKYGMTGSSQAWTFDPGDEMWDLKNAGIFSISLLEAEIRIYPDDSM
ncbi:hypothetical protein AVEN_224649-1 [Araneus ventricosus]|uniref:Uncharacterized protein n=1 Tax=Araneus ventricosus TaxID=182803 RepID=A0A4Y2TJX0_ARAVE|nr:hypothetical protein AVEN_224649-1 [Araneus ventricosus]